MISSPSFLDLSLFSYKNDKVLGDDFSCCIEFQENDPVFSGHYPNYPILPASLIIDICCQILNMMQSDACAYKNYFIKKSRFLKRIKPKDKVLFKTMASSGIGNKSKAINIHLFSKEEQCARIHFVLYDGKLLKTKETTARPLEMGHSMPAHEHLPQRFPLLVVDQVSVHLNKKMSSGTKLVSYGDYCYRNTQRRRIKKEEFVYPAGGVIEGIEQSAVLLLAEHWPMSSGEIVFTVGGINGIHIHREPYPGDIIRYYSKLEYISESNAILSGVAQIDDGLVMTIDKIFVAMKSRQQIDE